MKKVIKLKIKKKLIPVRQLYDRSRDAIARVILTNNKPHEDEINIRPHYNRSQKILGTYVTLDWEHRQDIKRLQKRILEYSNDHTLKRPLNIMMLAEPGAGKSHFIKCLAKTIGINSVNYNMATLKDIDDLIQPLEAVRNFKVVQDRLPLLFLDEFDSKDENYPLLLPLLWEGEVHASGRDIRLGKVIIVMAGSSSNLKSRIDEVRSMKIKSKGSELKEDKFIDLLSRINGGVLNIPPLDLITTDRNRQVDKVCLTIALLQQRFGQNLEVVPWCLLRFVGVTKFRYGVRSIAHFINAIPLNLQIEERNALFKEHLVDLPLSKIASLQKSSLVYHLITDGEPQKVIDLWNDVIESNTLVRFYDKPLEQDEEVKK